MDLLSRAPKQKVPRGTKLLQRGSVIEHVVQIISGTYCLNGSSDIIQANGNIVGLCRLYNTPKSLTSEYSITTDTESEVRILKYDDLKQAEISCPSLFASTMSRLLLLAFKEASVLSYGFALTHHGTSITPSPSVDVTEALSDIASDLCMQSDDLQSIGQVLRVNSQDCIVSEGCPLRIAIIVLKGRIARLGPDGSLICHHRTREYIGLETVIGSIYPYTYSLFAVDPTDILVISKHMIDDVGAHSPALAANTTQRLLNKFMLINGTYKQLPPNHKFKTVPFQDVRYFPPVQTEPRADITTTDNKPPSTSQAAAPTQASCILPSAIEASSYSSVIVPDIYGIDEASEEQLKSMIHTQQRIMQVLVKKLEVSENINVQLKEKLGGNI